MTEAPPRPTALGGATYLLLRQFVGMGIALVGTVCLTAILKPSTYGVFASCLALVMFVRYLGGFDVALMRTPDLGRQIVSAATTAALVAGSVAGIGLGLSAGRVAGTLGFTAHADALRLAALVLPVVAVAQVPRALIERNLDYQAIAKVELIGQLTLYLVAVPGAFLFGVTGAVAAFVVQQALLLILLSRLACYRPSFTARRVDLALLVPGLSYSASMLIWQGRLLVNPVLVGAMAGPSAVGTVALAIRLVEALAVAKGVAWRLGLPLLARIERESSSSLSAAVRASVVPQAIAIAVPLGLAYHVVIPHIDVVLGREWEGVGKVFLPLAAAYVLNGALQLYLSAAYLRLLGRWATASNVANLLILVGVVVLATESLGARAFGLAELLAAASNLILLLGLWKGIGMPGPREWLSLGLACTLFAPWPLALIALIGVVILNRKQLLDLYHQALRSRRVSA